eukprot:1177151-Prorocentrum_minimum.AAC.7
MSLCMKCTIPLPPKIDPTVTMMTVEEKPDVTYSDIGGSKEQIEKRACVCLSQTGRKFGVARGIRGFERVYNKWRVRRDNPFLLRASGLLSMSSVFMKRKSIKTRFSPASGSRKEVQRWTRACVCKRQDGMASLIGSDCVGLLTQMREVVEMPMLHPEKFVKLGIDPPKGVLCYGPPGTGKTLLARAVANRTDACFIRVIGSELVQKYVGEGARMVRELFQMARQKKACIIFFDEVSPTPPRSAPRNVAVRSIHIVSTQPLHCTDHASGPCSP